MNTLDPKELGLATSLLPNAAATPTSAAPTPGVALAGAQVPGAPTHPDWDPSALALLVGKMANELFAAPPGASEAMSASPGLPTQAGAVASPALPQADARAAELSSRAGSMASPDAARAADLSSRTGAAASGPAQADGVRGVELSSRPGTSPPSFAPGDSGRPADLSSRPGTSPPSFAQGDSARAAELSLRPGDALAPAELVRGLELSLQPDAGATATALAEGEIARALTSVKPMSAPLPTQMPGEFPASPFATPLRLDGLGEVDPAALSLPTGAALALVDERFTAAAAPEEAAVPYWLAAPDSVSLPSVDVPTYEVSPLATPLQRSAGVFDAHALRREFPILQERVHGKPLVWLDNAATTQKPRAVIDRLARFYERENSNIHRAAHTLAARATDAYESARETVRKFLNAPSTRDIVFVRGATEGINLVAQSWGRRNVAAGDEVVITWLEHHANIVPWQQLCAERGARLRVAPVDDTGQIILEEYEKLLGPRTRLVALPQVSNALGTITPARTMIEMAHRHGALVLLDGAQAVSHMAVDVQQLGCDFYVFSGHKVFAPTGIGVVFAKQALLDATPPWQGGGNMIADVTFERTAYQPAPARFEAGTGNIADAVGLGAALEWLMRVGLVNVARHEHDLLVYGTECLATVPGLTMIGTAPDKAGVLSFVLAGQKTEEVGGLLDRDGIAVRSGHHCAQPILRRFGVEATVRASLAPYNTYEDIDALTAALRRLQAGHGARQR
ncbi:family 2A encapsulin nanocompartment cargo protein cysteine desulfurase [Nannocystis sp. SCPEA4]|uniref:family 2A encapsulin nanocompartment cargo protein cysteine desulfurase n=1 Tax=Nannocystis sp. SCPEA4 TaxID=2996787 RepID=UPI0023EE4FF4|nr:family 2A encapsulin nanocompartment cargo protein cysteine desulfurase [Nannocystis sp. SCPEA4]